VAAGVLILMDYEQRQCPQDGQRSLLFSGWILFCCSVYCLAALRLWSASDALMSALHLTIPAVATGLTVLLGEWRRGRGPCGSRLARWLPLQATFAAGVLLPLAGWILWYWQADALSSLYDGLVVLPRRRLEYAVAPFPGLAAFAVSAVVTAAACLAVRRNRRQDPSYRIRHGQIWLRLGVCLVVVAAGYHVPQVRIVIFQAVRNSHRWSLSFCLFWLFVAGVCNREPRCLQWRRHWSWVLRCSFPLHSTPISCTWLRSCSSGAAAPSAICGDALNLTGSRSPGPG
ncbi:MAG: hypothetical protein ACKPJD_27340, partial [Planctomycetaceae bacterium]